METIRVQDLLALIALVAIFVGTMASKGFREIIQEVFKITFRVFELFFYRRESLSSDSREIERLQEEVNELKEELNQFSLTGNKEVIDLEIKKYVSNNLETILNEKINDSAFLERTVVGNLKSEVAKETKIFLGNIKEQSLQKLVSESVDAERRKESHENMTMNLEREANSASMLKMVMINLFVIATAAFLIFNIAIRPDLTTNAYIATVALYLSLGAFMLYIIRTSHFRSSVLLAIREQSSNYYNVLDYLGKTKNGNELTEHDVEVIRMLLVNRSEREQKADHPYEVILKGISGSNIQFKGGRMSLGGEKSDK